MKQLTKSYLTDIIREEAALSDAELEDALNMVSKPGLMNVRHRVWFRVHQETGATPRRIAEVWGCEPQSVFIGIAAYRRAWKTLEARKTWCRTAEHPERDLASWRALGRRGEVAA